MSNKSLLGYRDDSPYRHLPFININTPQGLIDMSRTGIPLFATDETGYSKILKPYSGIHKFKGKRVLEVPMLQSGGIKPKPRIGVRKNADGTESTHLMTYTNADGKWYAYPTLFQNADSTWLELSDKDNWAAFEEAKKRGELYEFKSEEEAKKFANGSWKKKFQDGGTRQPIYTTDKKKVQAYQDSLILSDPTRWGSVITNNDKFYPAYERLTQYNKKEPEYDKISSHKDNKNIYKKPVQPYIYQENPTLKRNNFRPNKLSLQQETNLIYPNIPSLDLSTPGMLPYRVEYDGTEHRDFPDEKSGTEFQNELRNRPQGIPYGTRGYYQSKPLFQDGGIKDYYTGWMNSPMYKKMNEGKQNFDAQRLNQLNTIKTQYVPQSQIAAISTNKSGNLGYYDKDENTVNINNKNLFKRLRPMINAHEWSHGMDYGGDFIPQEDLDLLGDKPSEVRALINQARWEFKNNNVFDPYTQPFDMKYINKPNNGIRNLRKSYSDDEINTLMNSISSLSNDYLPIARMGGTPCYKCGGKYRIPKYQSGLNQPLPGVYPQCPSGYIWNDTLRTCVKEESSVFGPNQRIFGYGQLPTHSPENVDPIGSQGAQDLADSMNYQQYDKNYQNQTAKLTTPYQAPPKQQVDFDFTKALIGANFGLSWLSKKAENNRQMDAYREQLQDPFFNPTFSSAYNDYGQENLGMVKKGGTLRPAKFLQEGGNFDAYKFLFDDDEEDDRITESDVIEASEEQQAELNTQRLANEQRAAELDDEAAYNQAMSIVNQLGYEGTDTGKVPKTSQETMNLAVGLRNHAMQLGLSKEEASGLIGNAFAESNFNPNALGDNNTSVGLFQHHKERAAALKKFAASQGKSWNDPFVQVEFAVHELNTSHKGARGNYANAAQAAMGIMNKFEKPAKWAKKESAFKRAGFAQQLMQYQVGGEYDLSQEEIDNLIKQGYKIKLK